ELAHDLAIHRDATSLNELLAGPARAHACLGKNLLQSDAFGFVNLQLRHQLASSTVDRSGRNGAKGGSSSSEARPMRSRNWVVVPNSAALPVSPTSVMRPRALSVFTTVSTLTPRI